MTRETTRRALCSLALGVGVGGMALSDARGFLEDFAPFSGSTWASADRGFEGDVSSPYGDATVRYDERGVPHVTADGEQAAYFAVGYAQAADRLFQMDLLRRVMRGELSAVVGESTLDSDRFHRQMDFARAADVTWNAAADGPAAPASHAYADGVNAYRDRADLPVEFELLDYEPAAWRPVDSILAQKQIAWGLTGDFSTLRRAAVRDAFDAETAATLYPLPDPDAHDAPILRPGEREPNPPGGGASDRAAPAQASTDGPVGSASIDPDLVSWLESFETGDGIGSNSWVVSGEYTASGDPIVANDPHLDLRVPPVWYEQHVAVEGDFETRGVTFPGVPFVVIGRNHAGAWGFTNAGVDVIDFYTYETRADGREYRYGDEWRAFDTREETIPVADAEDETITVTKSAHGAVLSRDSGGDPISGTDSRVAIQWTGQSSARTVESVRAIGRSDGVDDVLDALERFDEPTQCFVYADRDGRTLFYTTGQMPIRRTDGEAVAGTQVFDGSAREGEWPGFEPFGVTDWENASTVPFDEKPHSVDPGYLATANQRITDDPGRYLAEGYAAPFRGARIYERLDERSESGDAMTPSFLRDVQLDAVDRRVDHLRPFLDDARAHVTAASEGRDLDVDPASALAGVRAWDGEMATDRVEPLRFEFFARALSDRVFADAFDEAGLDVSEPSAWVLGRLPADSEWFVPDGGDEPERGLFAARAFVDALETIADEGYRTWGDYNRSALEHPFDRGFLNYPKLPTDGSPTTVNNFRRESLAGSSWRQIVPIGDDAPPAAAVLPGGNDGDPFSGHYHDQLADWAAGRYREFALDTRGEPAIQFRSGGDDE